jgi:hypothetical protein
VIRQHPSSLACLGEASAKLRALREQIERTHQLALKGALASLTDEEVHVLKSYGHLSENEIRLRAACPLYGKVGV